MMEALLLNRPIIAPDYLPYSYYIKTYGGGQLCEPDNELSLAEQMIRAKKNGLQPFISKLREFQKTLLFDEIANKFKQDIINSKDLGS